MTSKDEKICKVEAAILNAPFIDPQVYKECDININKYYISCSKNGCGELEYIQNRKNADKDTITVCICSVKGTEKIYVFMNTKTNWETVLLCIDKCLQAEKAYISFCDIALYEKEQYVNFTVEFDS